MITIDQIKDFKKNYTFKILVDTLDCMIVQSDDVEFLKMFNVEIDQTNLNFLMFHFKSPYEIYKIKMNLSDPTTTEKMKNLEKESGLEEDFLKNYVLRVKENLDREISSAIKIGEAASILSKYAKRSVKNYVIKEIALNAIKKLNDQEDHLNFLSTMVKNVDVDGFLELLKNETFANRIIENIDTQLSIEDFLKYKRVFDLLLRSDIKMKYASIFEDENVFVEVLSDLKEEQIHKIASEEAGPIMTLKKINALDYSTFEKLLNNRYSGIDAVFSKYDLLSYPKLLNHLRKFIATEHHSTEHFNVDFILKNYKILGLEKMGVEDEIDRHYVLIEELAKIMYNQEAFEKYEKEMSKIEEVFNISFADFVRKKIAKHRFGHILENPNMDVTEGTRPAFYALLMDSLRLNLFDSNIVKALLTFFFKHFHSVGKNVTEEMVTNFLNIWIENGLSDENFGDLFSRRMTEDEMISLGKVLYDLGYSTVENSNKDFKTNIMIDMCLIAYRNDKVEANPSDISEISTKYDFPYVAKENSFELILSSLNDLKPFIVGELEILNIEKTNLADDAQTYVDKIDSLNNKKIKEKYQIDAKTDLNDELSTKILSAVNDAIHDNMISTLTKNILAKLFKTPYFKKWSNGLNYKIKSGYSFKIPANELINYKTYPYYSITQENFVYETLKNIFKTLDFENTKIAIEESDVTIDFDVKIFNQNLNDLL